MLSLYAMSAKAQVFVTPTLPDNFLSNVTTSVLGTPASCPDDVTINCDMLSDANARPIKGIAWDEGTRSNQGHLYFEDGQGNSVFLQFNGVHPDIVLGDHHDNPGVDYRAAVVYIVTTSTNPITTYPMIDFYDLTGLGTAGFTATLMGTLQLSTSNLGTIYDSGPIPHIDMWSDNTAGAQINGYPAMWDFVATWEEQNNIYYNWGNIGSGTLYDPSLNGQRVNTGFSFGRRYTDVACYTDIANGNRFAAFTYVEGANVDVVELDFTGATPPSPLPALVGGPYNFSIGTTSNFLPRIEALSQWDSPNNYIPWQMVVSHNGNFWGYNRPNNNNDLSTVLLNGGNFKSTAIAAGVGNVSGEPNIGNVQYTAGYFEWSTWAGMPPNYYARTIDAVTGNVTDPDYYIVNTNPVTGGPPYCSADVSKSLALSNCSNSGDYLLSVWYDDVNGGTTGATGDIWYKLSGNTVPMQFRIGKIGNTSGTTALYPNPATDKIFLSNTSGAYTIYNVTGVKVAEGVFNIGERIDIAALSSGMYILKADGNTYKFIKQ